MRITAVKDRSAALLRNYAVVGLVGMLVGWLTNSLIGGLFGPSKNDHYPHALSLLSSSHPLSSKVAREAQWNDKSQGWSLIHVFYGTTDHLPILAKVPISAPKCNTWFAQARQDELVYNLLNGKRNGYFVDIAANDAIDLSNTYALETHFDWRGLCIEANPMYWPALSYRKCDVVGAVVAKDREEVQFRFSNKEFGGIVGDKFDNKKAPEQPRLTVTLMEVLHRFDSPVLIDYMSLDVEGAEDLVLQPTVLDNYQFNLITIERPSEPLQQLLQTKGYKLLKVLTEFRETLFVRQAIEPDLNMTALETIDTWHFLKHKPKKC